MKTLTTIAFLMTATTAFANDMEVHFNGGQAQSNCQTFLNNNNLSGKAQCHQAGNSGGGFNSDNDKSVSRVQVQGNDLVIAVTNQDPSGAYSKEHRVTLPNNDAVVATNTNNINTVTQQASLNEDQIRTNNARSVDNAAAITKNNSNAAALISKNSDDITALQGKTTPTNGADGKDAVSGLALVAALGSIKGDGIGFGLTKEEDSDFTFSTAVKFEIDNRTNVNIGITITEDGRKAASAGIGFSF